VSKKSQKNQKNAQPAAGGRRGKNQKNMISYSTVVDDFPTACFCLIENQIYKHVPCKSDICKLSWGAIDN
jgi:hypothetical protein